MAAIKKNDAHSASDVVVLGIIRGLERGLFVPAQRLTENDLVAQFGIGRNSVREALQRLASDGLVEMNRHRGASIRSLSIPEMLDVLDVAELMTGLLASTAARNAKNAAPAARVNEVLDGLESANRSDDPAVFSAARRRFYRTLLEIGGNRELMRLFPTIQLHIVHAQFRVPKLQDMRMRDYRSMGDAILKCDAVASESAGRSHVQHVREAIETMIASNVSADTLE